MIEIILYIVFGLSILFPVYTYAIYPLILKMLPKKKYVVNSIVPFVSVIIYIGNGNDEWKANNIKSSNYPNFEIIASNNINEAVDRAKGEVLVFVDNETELDSEALRNIVKPFSDKRIDLVVGEQTCKEGNSAFWKYETKVKSLESKIGSVSGANNSLFAIRESKMFLVPDKVKNVSFFISTKVKQNKGDVVYCPEARTYEKRTEGANFKHHVIESSGYWQAFILFWKMLFFRKGSFVYVSHRVMKWFVCLNMLLLLASSILLSVLMWPWIFAVAFQSLCYLGLLIFRSNDSSKTIISKLFNTLSYFILFNISFLFGVFYRGKK